MADFPEQVRLGGVWKNADGTMTGVGLTFRQGTAEEKAPFVIVGAGDRIVGRLWPNEKGPRFSGSLGQARAKLWFNDRKTESKHPDYTLAVERDAKREESRTPSPAPAGPVAGQGDDGMPFNRIDERMV